jgi:hypothetical protein
MNNSPEIVALEDVKAVIILTACDIAQRLNQIGDEAGAYALVTLVKTIEQMPIECRPAVAAMPTPDPSPESVERFDINWRDYRKDIDAHGDYVTYEAYASLSAQLTTAHAIGKAEGLREAAGRMTVMLDNTPCYVPFGEMRPFLSPAILALIPAGTPAAKVTVAACCWCGGSGMVLDSIGEPDRCHKCHPDTPAAKVQEAAKVLLDYLNHLDESPVWAAAQNAQDSAMSESADVVLAALRAIAGDSHD